MGVSYGRGTPVAVKWAEVEIEIIPVSFSNHKDHSEEVNLKGILRLGAVSDCPGRCTWVPDLQEDAHP